MTTKDYNNPMNKNYIKILKYFLTTLGAWPGNYRISKYITLILTACSNTGMLYYLVYNDGISLTLYGELCIAWALSCLGMGRTFLPFFKTYEKIFETYIRELHLIHFRHKKGIYEKMNNMIDKASDLFAKFIVLTWLCSLAFYNIFPIYNSFLNMYSKEKSGENVTIEFSLYWEFPGYPQEKPFILTSIINVLICWVCTGPIIATDLMIMLMVFQIIGHIKILEHNLRNLQYVDPKHLPQTSLNNSVNSHDVACHMFDQNTNLIISDQLKDCVNHHRFIVSFARDLSNFFGPSLAFSHLFHLFGCCLVLFECTQGNPEAFVRYLTLAIVIYAELGHLSIIFEIVLTASENLSSAIYSCPWEHMNISNRRLVVIMLMRMQTPIKVTAMGMTTVGVQTMAAILKATFSYYMFLRSKNN